MATTMEKCYSIWPDFLRKLRKYISELFIWKKKGRWFNTSASFLPLLSVTSWTWTSSHYQVAPVWLTQGNNHAPVSGRPPRVQSKHSSDSPVWVWSEHTYTRTVQQRMEEEIRLRGLELSGGVSTCSAFTVLNVQCSPTKQPFLWGKEVENKKNKKVLRNLWRCILLELLYRVDR